MRMKLHLKLGIFAFLQEVLGATPAGLVDMLRRTGEQAAADAKGLVRELSSYLAAFTGSMEIVVEDADAQPVVVWMS